MQHCKEAGSHQQRARTDRTLDLTSTSKSSTSTSTLSLTLYSTRINLSREAPIQDKRHLQPSPRLSEPGPNPPNSSVSSSKNRLPANCCALPPSWQSTATYPNLPLRLNTSIGKGQVPASQKTAACKPDIGGASGCTAQRRLHTARNAASACPGW